MNLDVTKDLENRRLKVVLTTKLTPAECRARLSAGIDSDWLRSMQWAGEMPVIGKVKSDRFRIRKRIWYHNSFQRCLSGRITTSGQRTHIHVKSGIHPFVSIFFAIWLGIAAFPIVNELMNRIMSRQIDFGSLYQLGLTPSAGFLYFGALLFIFGYWLSRGEVKFLEDFLKETLTAERA